MIYIHRQDGPEGQRGYYMQIGRLVFCFGWQGPKYYSIRVDYCWYTHFTGVVYKLGIILINPFFGVSFVPRTFRLNQTPSVEL